MPFYVILTVFLYQRGSAESKKHDGTDEVDEDPLAHRNDPGVRSAVRAGGWRLTLYKNSLSLVLMGLFLVSCIGHAAAGAGKYSEEQRQHGSTETEVVTVSSFTNDNVEHARRTPAWVLSPERVLGVETGACPHTAARDRYERKDPSPEINGRLSRLHSTSAPFCVCVARTPCRTLRPPVWWLGSHRSRVAKTLASGLWIAYLAYPIVADSRWPCVPPFSPLARAQCLAAEGRERAPVFPSSGEIANDRDLCSAPASACVVEPMSSSVLLAFAVATAGVLCHRVLGSANGWPVRDAGHLGPA